MLGEIMPRSALEMLMDELDAEKVTEPAPHDPTTEHDRTVYTLYGVPVVWDRNSRNGS